VEIRRERILNQHRTTVVVNQGCRAREYQIAD
jgi:hypothetical protein